MTDCPVCQKRQAQECKEAEQCKQQVKKLEARTNALILILAVLTALVGAELLEQALSITDTVQKVSELSVDPEKKTSSNQAQANSNKPIPNRQVFHSENIFGYVPPLLAELRVMEPIQPIDFYIEFQGNALVPEVGSGLILVGAFIANNAGRKR